MKIVILTSNEYLHCLPGFMYLFNRHFQTDTRIDIVGYDRTPLLLKSNYRWHSLGNQADYTWSAGLYRYVATVIPDEGHILIMLEDYWLSKDVDMERFQHACDLMIGEPAIGKIDLSGDRHKVKHTHSLQYPGYILSDPTSAWQTSTQAAIWRTDFLAQYLASHENAWSFEKRGTKRVIHARKSGEEIRLILGIDPPIMKYINAIGGEGSRPKVWAKKRFPQPLWDELVSLKLIIP